MPHRESTAAGASSFPNIDRDGCKIYGTECVLIPGDPAFLCLLCVSFYLSRMATPVFLRRCHNETYLWRSYGYFLGSMQGVGFRYDVSNGVLLDPVTHVLLLRAWSQYCMRSNHLQPQSGDLRILGTKSPEGRLFSCPIVPLIALGICGCGYDRCTHVHTAY